jgi:crotonobetainyl-CoA:carnitine CoA-transferase CaiB-like acyl-CoA transferase
VDVTSDSMLTPYRVLDLTNERGYLCGKLLGDLGADVIKIERPGGDPGRNIGPFYKDIPDPEKSLFWFAFNANKRGITLNIETVQGREIFKRLVLKADFVVESFGPGYMESLGLGYPDLNRINSRIIMASITTFGTSGPYRDYKSSDLIDAAMGGIVYSNGDPDRAPVRVSLPHTFHLAAAEAAAGSAMALLYREKTGEGQLVEVQGQRAVVGASYDVVPWWYGPKVIRKRRGSVRRQPSTGVNAIQMWPCQDGYVTFFFFGGLTGVAGNKALVDWMDSEGFATDFIRQMDWNKLDWSKVKQEYVDQFQMPVARFFASHTKTELLDGAVERGIQIYPLSSVKDILQSRQLKARDYWEEVRHPELNASITYPGAFIRSSETPIKTRLRAPTIGEHNLDIYQNELGFSREELVTLKQAGII